MRIGPLEPLRAKPFEPSGGAFRLLAPFAAKQLERQAHVIERAAPRQEAILLKHGGEHAAEMIEIVVGRATGDGDSPLRRPVETDEQVKEGGFTTARLPHDRHHIATADAEVEAIDRHYRVARDRLPEQLAQPSDFDVGGIRHHARHRSIRSSMRVRTASARNSTMTRMSVQANTSATEKSSCAITSP